MYRILYCASNVFQWIIKTKKVSTKVKRTFYSTLTSTLIIIININYNGSVKVDLKQTHKF